MNQEADKESMQVETLDCAEKRTLLQSEIKVPSYPQSRHLKPCKPGETHNPHGRPKGAKNTLRAQLRSFMRRNPTAPIEAALSAIGVDPKDINNAGALAATLFHQAIVAQDVQAARLIATHCERPLKTDQPDTGQTVNILIPDLSQAREVLARRGSVILPEQRRAMFFGDAGESAAQPAALPASQPQIEPPVDPMDELASFAV